MFIALLALMAAAADPPADGARVAIAFDRDGELASHTAGLADPATRRPVTADDPVRVASISKMIVTIGVMRLVEQGEIDLDRPVGEYLGYPVINPAFADQPVTLRRLLSHTSSLRDHDDQYAIPLGATLKAVLDDPASWDNAHGPGDGFFTYSNLNFPVVGSIVERVSGERFDRAMRRLVLEPLKLDACFNWPTCSDRAIGRAIVLMQDGEAVKDDLHGRRPDCPVQAASDDSCDLTTVALGANGSLFAPQGGLRVSARGLEKIGRLLADGGEVDGVRLLKPESVALMTTPVWTFDGTNGESEGGFYCRYGLGVMLIATAYERCADNPGLPEGDWIGHAGEAYGLRSGLWIDRRSGHGIAYFTTGLTADPPPGSSGFVAAEEQDVATAIGLLNQHR